MRADTLFSSYYSEMGQLVKKLNLLNREQKVCYGLTLSQCYTIEALGQKGSLTMNELSGELGVTVSTMTRIITVLVRDGVVLRQENPQDRRQVKIQLTDEGKKLKEKLRRCSESYSKAILDQIPEQERNNVLSALKILNNAIDQLKSQCCI